MEILHWPQAVASQEWDFTSTFFHKGTPDGPRKCKIRFNFLKSEMEFNQFKEGRTDALDFLAPIDATFLGHL